MNRIIQKKLWYLIAIFFINLVIPCTFASNPFSVSFVSGPSKNGTPVLFNMVPGSKQQLKFNVLSTDSQQKIIKCGITKSALDGSAILAGCTNKNGAATPAPIIITFTSGKKSGRVEHILVVRDLSGRNVIKIPLIYNIVANSSRTITFENYCNYDVWFGIATGTLPPLSGSSCSGPANCPKGTECRGGKCFWIPPIPTKPTGNTTYKLNLYNGGPVVPKTIRIPDESAKNTSPKLWSGGFAARTGCTFTAGAISCTTGDCGDDGTGRGGCEVGKGFTAPITQAEVTFLVKKPDSYDITLINGFNVPTSFSPTTIPVGTSNPYDCGSPGGTQNVSYKDVLYSTISPPPNGILGGCSWNFTPPSSNLFYQWVDNATVTSCSLGSPCTGSLSCGLTMDNVTANTPALTCGNFLGYWTQDEICATNKNFISTDIVDCTSKTQITDCSISPTCPVAVSGQYFFSNLLACTSSPPDVADNKLTFASCFAAAGLQSSSNCCGCNNWQNTTGFTGSVPTDPKIVAQCNTGNNTRPNSKWVNNVLTNLIWLKNACPSAYTYPYDDKTSSFGCPYAYELGQSAVDYTVTFCPNRKPI